MLESIHTTCDPFLNSMDTELNSGRQNTPMKLAHLGTPSTPFSSVGWPTRRTRAFYSPFL